jgi:hypothetical protein
MWHDIHTTFHEDWYIKYIVPLDTLKLIYFSHIHSIISYGIIFWGSSSYANKVFILQKKVIRIITNIRPKDSCGGIFKNIEIMTLYSQYIYSLLLYTINNKYLFNTNNEIHKYQTRSHNNLHLPAVTLTEFNKGAYISGINIFNHLPQSIKILANDEKSFKSTMKRFYIIILFTPWMNIINTKRIKVCKLRSPDTVLCQYL